jgi:gamma-glutamyl:cysteine ligase YbdK (ATP-grasp superfamily)
MDPTVTVALIVSVPTAIVSLLGFIFNHNKLQTIQVGINGRITDLIDARERAARAEAETVLLSVAAQKAAALIEAAADTAKKLLEGR